jgi:hypothetical protein
MDIRIDVKTFGDLALGPSGELPASEVMGGGVVACKSSGDASASE